jgi:DNA-binding transcriptional ArsR family regulator
MSITQTVAAIGRLGFTGNVTPKIWYKQISLPSGRPDHKAITLLSEILYWYRPTEIRDEHTGQVVGHRKKFSDDKLQRSYQSFSDDFGMTKREVQDSLKRLRDAGLITLELRSKTVGGNYIANLLYIEPVAFEIDRITFPIAELESASESEQPTPNRRTTSENSEVVLRENVDAPTLKRGTYTEITTKTSTETKSLDLLSDSAESNVPAVVDDSVPFDAKAKRELLAEAFERVWVGYGRRGSKKPAEDKFLKLKLPANRSEAIGLLQNIIDKAKQWGELYAQHPSEVQFQPHTVRWVKEEKWNDEELPTIRQPHSGGSALPVIGSDRQDVNDALTNIHDTDWM